jgi:hypothetical protein
VRKLEALDIQLPRGVDGLEGLVVT